MLKKLNFAPGIVKDDPDLTSEGRYVDAQWVRFRLGKPETIGGWQVAANGTLRGHARAGHAWADYDGRAIAAIGTNLEVAVVSGGQLFDVTPIRSSGTYGTDPFATTAGSDRATVTHAGHGAADGDTVYIHAAATVGGVVIGGGTTTLTDPFVLQPGSLEIVVNAPAHGYANGDIVNISGATAVGGITPDGDYTIRVVDPDYYIIYSDTVATDAASGGGTPTFKHLRPYQLTWASVDTYTIPLGTAATSTATGGGTTAGYRYELVTGAEDYVPPGGGYGVGRYGLGSYGSGDSGEQRLRTVSLFNWGKNLIFAPERDTLYSWGTNLGRRAEAVAGAPAEINFVFATPERFVVALGTINEVTGLYDPLMVRWCDQENYTDWASSATNVAGGNMLQEGTRIVAGAPSRGANLLWTDTGLYSMRYLGDLEFVFGFELLGTGCGILGPHAFAERDGMAFWMSSTGQFYTYAGGAPQAIPCPVRDYVFGGLNKTQQGKVSCGINAAFNEVWWLYPHESDECNAYVAYNWAENTWVTGFLDRSVFFDGAAFKFPIAAGGDGNVYFHESGTSAAGAAIDAWIETAYADLDDGETVQNVSRIVPDLVATGGVEVTIKTKRWPQDVVEQEKTRPYLTTTRKIDVRAQGRQIALKVRSNDPDTEWRLGDLRVDLAPGGPR